MLDLNAIATRFCFDTRYVILVIGGLQLACAESCAILGTFPPFFFCATCKPKSTNNASDILTIYEYIAVLKAILTP